MVQKKTVICIRIYLKKKIKAHTKNYFASIGSEWLWTYRRTRLIIIKVWYSYIKKEKEKYTQKHFYWCVQKVFSTCQVFYLFCLVCFCCLKLCEIFHVIIVFFLISYYYKLLNEYVLHKIYKKCLCKKHIYYIKRFV